MVNYSPPKFEKVVDANTLALWHFNEKSGSTTFADATGTYPLSSNGSPTAGSSGNVLSPGVYLDNVDDWLYNNTLLDTFPANGAIELWFCPNIDLPNSTNHPIIDKSNINSPAERLYIYLYSDGYIYYYMAVNGSWTQGLLSTTHSWTHGVWHHLGFTWGSRGMELWVDGVIEASNPAWTGVPSNGTASDFFIAKVYNAATYHLVSTIEEMVVSNIQRLNFGGGIAPAILV